jgi:CRISPR-associated endonuclease/helicase Cas3
MSISKYYEDVLKANGWQNSRRKYIDYAISEIEEKWQDKNVFIIEAPTGYGKTTISQSISLYSFYEEFKSIVAFPLRTLLEDQFDKFKKTVPNELTEILGKRYMHNPDSRYLVKPITLTTVDTLSLTLFGLAPEDLDKVVKGWSGTFPGSMGHYLFSWSSTFLSNLVLDEVHLVTDSTKSINFLFALIQLAIENNLKLILMSATIPTALKNLMQSYFNKWKDKILFLNFDKNSPSYDENFVAERKKKNYEVVLMKLNENNKFSKIFECLEQNWNNYKRVIVVFNTVDECVHFYEQHKERLDQLFSNKILLHSRFTEEDRENKNKQLKAIKEKKLDNYIIISTQVIEAGVDISSNLFITDIAPMNSLIQRLGRFLRYEGEYDGKVYIWYEVDADKGDMLLKKRESKKEELYKVYDWDLTNRTLNVLKEAKNEGYETINFKFHIPEDYKTFIDCVYKDGDFSPKKEEIDSLLKTHMNFNYGSYEALEEFFKLEGSFVRDGLIIPVTTLEIFSELVSKHHEKIEEVPLREIARYSIPLSFDVFKILTLKSRINGEIYSERDEASGKKVLKRRSVDPEVLQKRTRESKPTIKYIMQNSIVSFLVDVPYDCERGLMCFS